MMRGGGGGKNQLFSSGQKQHYITINEIIFAKMFSNICHLLKINIQWGGVKLIVPPYFHKSSALLLQMMMSSYIQGDMMLFTWSVIIHIMFGMAMMILL